MAEELDELTLTAYALGELDGSEHAEKRTAVEALLAGDPSARRQVQDIRATAALLTTELSADTVPGLSAIQHAAIERQLAAVSEPYSLRPLRRNWALWGSLAASVAIVCTVMASVLPRIYQKGKTSGESSTTTGSGPLATNLPAPAPEPRDPILPTDGGGIPMADVPMDRGEIAFARVNDVPLSNVPTTTSFPNDAFRIAMTEFGRLIAGRQLPPADLVRTDEFVNGLPYHYAAPLDDSPIAASMEVAGCPWDSGHRLLRIGLRTAGPGPATNPSTQPAASYHGVAGLKLQVEFNPAVAGAYRLIGYETGTGNYRDGSLDSRAGGILPAGRSLTALFEVIPAGSIGAPAPLTPLKYQKLTPVAETSRELATVSIHYRDAGQPPTAAPKLLEIAVSDSGKPIADAGEDFRAAAAAATLALSLRDSPYKGTASFEMAADLLAHVSPSAPTAQLLDLANKARTIAGTPRQ